MSTTLRLFSIEARRNAAIWFVPIIVGVAWWVLSAQYWTTFLWRDTNDLLQRSAAPFAAPAMAGIAAWMAGRNRRRGIEDLLNSTPCPSTRRRLILWTATALWGLAAYALFATYMMGQTALQATWGGPAFWPVATVVLALLAHAAWGFFVGGLLPSRFTAPLVGIGALGLQQFAASHSRSLGEGSSMSTWVNELAAHNSASEWQSVFYLGLTGMALAAIALRDHWNARRAAALFVTTGVALSGVVMVWGEYPRFEPVGPGLVNSAGRNNFGQVISFETRESPLPICKGTPVSVCVHPAYQPVLNEAIVDAAELAEPLLGLPDVPMQLEARNIHDSRLDVSEFVDALVADSTLLRDGQIVNGAQIAIRSWLLERANIDQPGPGCNFEFQQPADFPSSFWVGQPTPETCEATDRFSALSPSEQRAWLEEHYTALRAGELTLEDLP